MLPFLIGFTLGNLDEELRELFGRCVHPLIPFFGFALGNGIDLNVIAKSGLPGIALGLAVIVVTGVPLMLADKLLGGGNGTAGLAASSTAGAAVANPAIIGEMIPKFADGAGRDGDRRDRLPCDGDSRADIDGDVGEAGGEDVGVPMQVAARSSPGRAIEHEGHV